MEIWKQIAVCALAAALLAVPGRVVGADQTAELAAARIKWLKLKAEIEAAGYPFDLKQFNTAPIPDAENFAAHPLIAELFEETAEGEAPGSTGLGKIDYAKKFPHQPRPWRESIPIDLPAIAGDENLDPSEAAKKILRELEQWEDELDGLVAAAKRPKSRYPTDWSEQIPPVMGIDLIGARKHLELRALCNLRSGFRASARQDTLALLRITRHGRADPSMLGVLVANAGNSLAYQCIWEGMKQQQWDEVSLMMFESELRRANIPAQFATTIRYELGFGDKFASDLLSGDKKVEDIFGAELYRDLHALTPLENYANRSLIAERVYQILLDRRSRLPVLHPSRLKKLDALVGQVPDSAPLWHPHRSLATFRMVGIICLEHQADLSNARIAIALERYRLTHKKLPATLDDLTPKFLAEIPADPMTGEAPRYLIRSDGTPAIYSVGWNGDDDGGRPALETRDDGDWVWQMVNPGEEKSR